MSCVAQMVWEGRALSMPELSGTLYSSRKTVAGHFLSQTSGRAGRDSGWGL